MDEVIAIWKKKKKKNDKRDKGPGGDVLEVELCDIFMALLMFNNISMSTMHFSACLPPPFFSLLSFLTHIHIYTTRGGENDLSAALNSLHFYSLEWTGSTKGDIIFSGFDWPPPCHKMTSCKPPPQTLYHHLQHYHTTPPTTTTLCSWMLGYQDNRARPRPWGRTWQRIAAWLSIISSGSVAVVFVVNSLGK